MRSALDPDARTLGALYDEGYYHGVNSGYPSSGYESEHASWEHWVRRLAPRYGRGARWLDLGCAYGYLVAEARAGGFDAIGIDVSAYALGRAGRDAVDARGRVVRGLLEALPFPDASLDVVSAFDVLEHLADPEPALAEARRVLRPGGAFIGATPDPCVFDRHEATHFSERPPSYWIDRLLALGFGVDFRFFQAPFNLEWLAVRADAARLLPASDLRPEGFGSVPDLGTVTGGAGARVAVRLRAGWADAGTAQPAPVRWLGDGEASAYVLVSGRAPVRLAVDLELSAAAEGTTVTIALDDQELARVTCDPAWRVLAIGALPVAAGGHHLRIRGGTPLLVRRLALACEAESDAALLARLPFDMYQRYDQCRAAVTALATPVGSVLDLGGVLGGNGGHLATARDFFPAARRCVSADVRPSDQPEHHVLAGPALPFPDGSFDLVVSQDVLEHVPVAERRRMLDEIARVARRFVLLGAPFATAGVAAADALLFGLIEARHGYRHQFLAEHLEHGHPDLAGTVAYWEARGAIVAVLPNGHLPYWLLMQVANLRLAEPALGERYARGQALYNGVVRDWEEPAYRHLLVIDVTGARSWLPAVAALARPGAADAAAARNATALNAVLGLAFAAPLAPAPLPLASTPARVSVETAAVSGSPAGVAATTPLPTSAPTATGAAPAVGGWSRRTARLGRALLQLVARGARTSIR
jgi:SAM-dependent methyltransferase